MEKRKWIIVCPSCEVEEETDKEYTEVELDMKGLLIDAPNNRVIQHCLSCRLNANHKEY